MKTILGFALGIMTTVAYFQYGEIVMLKEAMVISMPQRDFSALPQTGDQVVWDYSYNPNEAGTSYSDSASSGSYPEPPTVLRGR